VPHLDISGVQDEVSGTLTFFAVNGHGGETPDVEIGLQSFGSMRIVECQGMASPDLEAINALNDPNSVTAKKGARASVVRNALSVQLPPIPTT
jgi:alpha-L-arabinofuranosidase